MKPPLKQLSPLLALSLLSVFALPVCASGVGSIGVAPAVQQWEPGSGTLTLAKDGLVITVDAKDAAALATVAKELQTDLTAMGFTGVTIRSAQAPSAGTVFLALASQPLAHGVESYAMGIHDGVVITGGGPAGVLYGTRSLLQMSKAAPAGAMPQGVVTDYPDYSHRMLMLDVARKPYPLPALKDYIRMMAWYKMNELHLHLSDEAFGGDYTGFRIQCDTFPGLTSKDLFYTKAQIRDLQDFAKGYGVTITPEFDMPGHARCFTKYWPDCMLKDHPSYLDVNNPKTITNLEKLVDEMIPLFDAPDFHIGTDEYRVNGPDKQKLYDGFRRFINTMNAHIRSKGKNCRIWSGFESMKSDIAIDPSVVIDMWETYDALGQIKRGHNIINSNQGVSYIVPGAHYYGISCANVYNNYEPWEVSGNPAHNPKKDDPHLYGGKLHVWGDHGPTGYNMTEIADLTLPGIQAFSEKMWGTKGSADYREYTKRAAATLPVPGVTVLDRLPAGADGVVLDMPQERTLSTTDSVIDLPLAKAGRADLEYPWTLSMQVMKTEKTAKRGVILASDLVEICDNYDRKEEIKTKFADGTERKVKVDFSGIGLIRAAGARKGAETPEETYESHGVSHAFGKKPALNQWTTLTVVGTRGAYAVYLDGVKIGEDNNQMVCPLRTLGSPAGQSFVGKVRNLKVVNRALTEHEIGLLAGVDIPEDMAPGCKVTASRTGREFDPGAVTAEDGSVRWSSGGGGAPTWLAIDLGAPKTVAAVALKWETAYAKNYAIEVSSDDKSWKEVFAGKGEAGDTRAEFAPVNARFVRIQMKNAATGWGYSLWHVRVYPPKQK